MLPTHQNVYFINSSCSKSWVKFMISFSFYHLTTQRHDKCSADKAFQIKNQLLQDNSISQSHSYLSVSGGGLL